VSGRADGVFGISMTRIRTLKSMLSQTGAVWDQVDTQGCKASVLIVEVENNEVIGFVSGTASMKPIYRQLLRKALHLLMTLLTSLIRP